MADNYLEKKFEDMQARRAKEERAKEVAWKKRMDAYRKRLEAEKAAQELLLLGHGAVSEMPDDLSAEVASDADVLSVSHSGSAD